MPAVRWWPEQFGAPAARSRGTRDGLEISATFRRSGIGHPNPKSPYLLSRPCPEFENVSFLIAHRWVGLSRTLKKLAGHILMLKTPFLPRDMSGVGPKAAVASAGQRQLRAARNWAGVTA